MDTIALRQVPSPADVKGWSDSVEQGGIVFVLLAVIVVLGWVAYRNMKQNDQRIADLERRNDMLTEKLLYGAELLRRADTQLQESRR